jgi:hypothetical protein
VLLRVLLLPPLPCRPVACQTHPFPDQVTTHVIPNTVIRTLPGSNHTQKTTMPMQQPITCSPESRHRCCCGCCCRCRHCPAHPSACQMHLCSRQVTTRSMPPLQCASQPGATTHPKTMIQLYQCNSPIKRSPESRHRCCCGCCCCHRHPAHPSSYQTHPSPGPVTIPKTEVQGSNPGSRAACTFCPLLGPVPGQCRRRAPPSLLTPPGGHQVQCPSAGGSSSSTCDGQYCAVADALQMPSSDTSWGPPAAVLQY